LRKQSKPRNPLPRSERICVIKSYAQWAESRLPLDKSLSVGEVIDDALVNYFVAVMPPAYVSPHLIQIGEPDSHVDGKAAFATISKSSPEGWVYKGNCFRGSDSSPDTRLVAAKDRCRDVCGDIVQLRLSWPERKHSARPKGPRRFPRPHFC
jgi:hypothetical protein